MPIMAFVNVLSSGVDLLSALGRMDLVTFDGRAISLYDIQYGMEWYLYTGYLQCTHVNRTIQWCAIISYLKRRYSILWR